MSATSAESDSNVTAMPGANNNNLKSKCDAIIELMEQRDAITDQIKEVMNDIGEGGFNKPAVRHAIKRMRMDPEKREELDANLLQIANALNQPDLFG